MCGCLSLCGPVMDWRPVQGVTRLSPDVRWDWLQRPTDGLSGYRKWMETLDILGNKTGPDSNDTKSRNTGDNSWD